MKLCIPLKAKTLDQLVNKIQIANQHADIIELWLGELLPGELDMDTIFSIKEVPYLLNCKGPKEKGSFQGTDAVKFEILREGMRRGAEYVDIDHDFPRKLIKKFIQEKDETELILSAHFFHDTPRLPNLMSCAKSMLLRGAEILKIATFAKNERDLTTIMKLSTRLKEKNLRFITLAMGNMGKASRIITPLLGGEMMFACLIGEEATAEGQMTVNEMKNIWNTLK